jgi:hypothetical protein
MTDTDNWTEPGYEDDHGGNLVNDLRKQLKAKADAEKEMATKLAKLEGQVRKQTISEVLSSKGVPSKVAALIPGDVESTPEGVSKWLEEYGEVFNIPKSEGQQTAEPVVEQGTVDAIQTMQDVTASAETPRIGGPVTQDDLMNAKSLDDLRALIARGS